MFLPSFPSQLPFNITLERVSGTSVRIGITGLVPDEAGNFRGESEGEGGERNGGNDGNRFDVYSIKVMARGVR